MDHTHLLPEHAGSRINSSSQVVEFASKRHLLAPNPSPVVTRPDTWQPTQIQVIARDAVVDLVALELDRYQLQLHTLRRWHENVAAQGLKRT